MSAVLYWNISPDGSFGCVRSLVFPMLRTVPNNTHASLTHRMSVNIPSLLDIDGNSLTGEKVEMVEIDGYMSVSSTFSKDNSSKPVVRLKRSIFPSVNKPMLGELYSVMNISSKPRTLYIPEFSQIFTTLPEKGVRGSYTVRADIIGSGTFILKGGESIEFGVVYQGGLAGEKPIFPCLKTEFEARKLLIRQLDSNLILETPDPVLNREFRFAKIRGSESIFQTAGGLMHGPGGEAFYAAIWANDQAEYINPFFPFEGYATGNESAMNAYMHFARFMNDEYAPIPSSIIAEGTDIWNGAGDRGDAAMIAYGAARYALASGSTVEARKLWPLISWCLEYCKRKLNDAGVVASDSDELEGRFPAGKANLCTSTLYYDALLSSSMLAKELGITNDYRRRASVLGKAIENYFGAEVSGFHTYRYYDGNDCLRSWICMPLIVGLKQRTAGTIAALTSPLLMTENGLLTQEGSKTFWDRSTLYAIRGIFIAGQTDKAAEFLSHYSGKRLLGDHVPYPVEAWPEGNQRHLSAESGLYCRAITEGLFGIRPTGLKSFDLSARLPSGWSNMSLRHIRAFQSDFDIIVTRDFKTPDSLVVVVHDNETGRNQKFWATEGRTLKVSL